MTQDKRKRRKPKIWKVVFLLVASRVKHGLSVKGSVGAPVIVEKSLGRF